MNYNEQELKEIEEDVQKFSAIKNLRLTGRPDRTTLIGSDDILNLQIALSVELGGSKRSLNSFLKMV
jgi:flagellar motor switch/type III secretory pathway protein FliN